MVRICSSGRDCFQYIKGTKKKANHNANSEVINHPIIVSNTSKVLKRKQITTRTRKYYRQQYCFQYIKGTKKKANHNCIFFKCLVESIVSNTSKVLKRKQITTHSLFREKSVDCFQYIKGTKKKANHNRLRTFCQYRKLFPIHQRY